MYVSGGVGGEEEPQQSTRSKGNVDRFDIARRVWERTYNLNEPR